MGARTPQRSVRMGGTRSSFAKLSVVYVIATVSEWETFRPRASFPSARTVIIVGFIVIQWLAVKRMDPTLDRALACGPATRCMRSGKDVARDRRFFSWRGKGIVRDPRLWVPIAASCLRSPGAWGAEFRRVSSLTVMKKGALRFRRKNHHLVHHSSPSLSS
jgi:hypothetical protein